MEPPKPNQGQILPALLRPASLRASEPNAGFNVPSPELTALGSF